MDDAAMKLQQPRVAPGAAQLVGIHDHLHHARDAIAQTINCGFDESVPVGGGNVLHRSLDDQDCNAKMFGAGQGRMRERLPDVDRLPQDEVGRLSFDTDVKDPRVVVP